MKLGTRVPSPNALYKEGNQGLLALSPMAFLRRSVRLLVPAGYSKRTLVGKLGIRPGTRVVALAAPPTYPALLGTLPAGVTLHSRLPSSSSFIHRFARRRRELAADFPRLARALTDGGILWISWPKRASGIESDLDENVVREIGLAEGLVDVKVCAVDEVWSGLKFVRRMENRG